VKERGKVYVPAFTVGRTQNLVYAVARRRAKGEFPEVPVFVDSPLAEEATRVFAGHPDLYDAELSAFAASGGRPFDPAGVQFLSRVEESRLLNDRPGPFVVIAGSGMCEGGRIVHHLRHGLSDPRNTVLFVGYAAPDTLARRILDGAAVVRMHGRDVPVRAAVEHIGALSAHADRKELLRFLEPAKAYGAEVILVHGDEDACLSFAETLRRRGHSRVRVPETYEEVPISKSREAAPPG
jgi:metallo-beta-lactamase family protein